MTTSVTTRSMPVTISVNKPFWQSKTFWLNALSIALAIFAIVDPALFGIDPKVLLLITGVLNILVRFLTTGPISLMGTRDPA
jgi:hypothetical protein